MASITSGFDLDATQMDVTNAFPNAEIGEDEPISPHWENVRELELMMESGIPVEDVLESCTVGGWESCGKDLCSFRFGFFEEGCRADIIALAESPLIERTALRDVRFVMKDAKVWKQDGQPVGVGLRGATILNIIFLYIKSTSII